jgi:hypothetical protein
VSEQEKDQEKIDQLLREAMSAPPPALSPGFDERLLKRARPRRLRPEGRLVLASYALAALAVSVWAMRSQSIEWTLIVTAVVVPILIIATLYRRHLYTPISQSPRGV